MLFSSFTFFLIFIPVLAAILLLVNFIFAPHLPYQEKGSTFECGFHSFLGQNRVQFNVAFFVFALLFLLFDIEIVLVYPFIVSNYYSDISGLAITITFLSLLTAGLVFELGKGALNLDSRQSSISIPIGISINNIETMENLNILKKKQSNINNNNLVNKTQKRMMTTLINKNHNKKQKFLAMIFIIITLLIFPVFAFYFSSYNIYLAIYIIILILLSLVFYIIFYSNMSSEKKSALTLSFYSSLITFCLAMSVRYIAMKYFNVDPANFIKNFDISVTWYGSICISRTLIKTWFQDFIQEGYNPFYNRITLGNFTSNITTSKGLPPVQLNLTMNNDSQLGESSRNSNLAMNQDTQLGESSENSDLKRTNKDIAVSSLLTRPKSPLSSEQKLQIWYRRHLEAIKEYNEQQVPEDTEKDIFNKLTLKLYTLNNNPFQINSKGKYDVIDPNNITSKKNPYIDPETNKPYNESIQPYATNLSRTMDEIHNEDKGGKRKTSIWHPKRKLSEKDFKFFEQYIRHNFSTESHIWLVGTNSYAVKNALAREK